MIYLPKAVRRVVLSASIFTAVFGVGLWSVWSYEPLSIIRFVIGLLTVIALGRIFLEGKTDWASYLAYFLFAYSLDVFFFQQSFSPVAVAVVYFAVSLMFLLWYRWEQAGRIAFGPDTIFTGMFLGILLSQLAVILYFWIADSITKSVLLLVTLYVYNGLTEDNVFHMNRVAPYGATGVLLWLIAFGTVQWYGA